MKKIPAQLIKDYIFVGLAFVVMMIFIHPAFCQDFRFEDSLDMNMVAQTLLLLASLMLAEVVVTYAIRFPFSYHDDIYTRLQHFLYCGGVCILISTACLNQLIAIIDCGFEHWYYAWTDHAGTFTLKWFVMTLPPCAAASLFTELAMTAISELRVMRYSIQEILNLNALLENEQKRLRLQQADDSEADKIVLRSDSRESLVVNPHEIIYIESVGNYLNITYLNDSDLCQKRLRSSLKDVEETLGAYPFIIHTHRAFLVNINYITQISGNSAGYKINMFSIDRMLPVSKANVAAFKEKITELSLHQK